MTLCTGCRPASEQIAPAWRQASSQQEACAFDARINQTCRISPQEAGTPATSVPICQRSAHLGIPPKFLPRRTVIGHTHLYSSPEARFILGRIAPGSHSYQGLQWICIGALRWLRRGCVFSPSGYATGAHFSSSLWVVRLARFDFLPSWEESAKAPPSLGGDVHGPTRNHGRRAHPHWNPQMANPGSMGDILKNGERPGFPNPPLVDISIQFGDPGTS